MFEIEDNVGMPARGSAKGMYPFEKMETGESFFVPCDDDEQRKMQAQISSACCYHTKTNPERKYATRSVKGGVRVWRIEPTP